MFLALKKFHILVNEVCLVEGWEREAESRSWFMQSGEHLWRTYLHHAPLLSRNPTCNFGHTLGPALLGFYLLVANLPFPASLVYTAAFLIF